MDELQAWLREACQQHNLSWREASMRAGVNAGAISAIMNGQRPGFSVCKRLAALFGVSPEYVLRLARHLPPAPEDAQRRDLEEVGQALASMPDGPIRDEAMAAIQAIARDALRRAQERQQEPVIDA
jgi:transcriptional regulator with XRE-family HTH domain